MCIRYVARDIAVLNSAKSNRGLMHALTTSLKIEISASFTL